MATEGCCGRVLVVEDQAPIRKLVTRIFERGGYEVASFHSPFEALGSHGAGAGLPDLLVVDLGLPGMTGRDLADRFKEVHPGLRVLFVSGSFEEGWAPAADGCDFVQKPFQPDELLDKASALLAA